MNGRRIKKKNVFFFVRQFQVVRSSEFYSFSMPNRDEWARLWRNDIFSSFVDHWSSRVIHNFRYRSDFQTWSLWQWIDDYVKRSISIVSGLLKTRRINEPNERHSSEKSIKGLTLRHESTPFGRCKSVCTVRCTYIGNTTVMRAHTPKPHTFGHTHTSVSVHFGMDALQLYTRGEIVIEIQYTFISITSSSIIFYYSILPRYRLLLHS